MAASRNSPSSTPLWFKLGLLLLCSASAYAAYQLNAPEAILAFFTGPGSYSRIFTAAFLVINWKSLPFAWSVRMWYCMIIHLFVRNYHTHTPDKLFHPVICESHTSLGEIDYRLHKSNSTYLSDFDVARSHLVSHLVARSGHLLARNAKHRLVMDPSDPTKPARGCFGIGIGAVHCAFKREIKPYQKYEMWSRILSWDRKWLYIVTHFVKKGAVLPHSWDAQSFGRTRNNPGSPQVWEKKIYATAVTAYVFKLGRLKVHPAVMLGASGLLPERPGAGGGANKLAEWTWERTEAERQRGYEYALHFAAMNGLHGWFDGGEDGALGRFALG
ncbi:hypothetical protein PG997_007167 [Apiospora hydei]|uniref:Capsule polysaccharide biosynthesis protein n=1 Tax=Apiospora hydei TaxID=1337664 RepID=A0ABR1WS39_9PEZI